MSDATLMVFHRLGYIMLSLIDGDDVGHSLLFFRKQVGLWKTDQLDGIEYCNLPVGAYSARSHMASNGCPVHD